MRAISRFIPEVGISTVSCSAWLALRMRVSMSPMGSVIIVASPARLRHARNHALVRKLAQADPAYAELAEVGARAPAAAAAVVGPRRVLRAPGLLDSESFLRHSSFRPIPPRTASRATGAARALRRRPSPS